MPVSLFIRTTDFYIFALTDCIFKMEYLVLTIFIELNKAINIFYTAYLTF